jgi:hypothetical protein
MSVEPPLMRDVLNGVLNSRVDGSGLFSSFPATQMTPAELAASVTPVNYAWPPNDLRRYVTAWTDGSDQTTGVQNAIKVAYATSGELYLPDGLNISISGVTLTMSGNRANQGFAIVGPGWNGAKITQTGSPGALITIVGATPTGNPSEAPLILQGFSLQGVGKTADGILLDGIAYFRISGVQVRGCNIGIHLNSALIGVIDQMTMSNENNYGLRADQDGTGSPCNAIQVRDSVFNLNSVFGVFLGSGQNWLLDGLDIEGNGTAANVNTGGIRIASSITAGLQYAIVSARSCWMESNLGTNFLVDAPSVGSTYISLDSMLMITAEAHRELVVTNASNVAIRNSFSPGAGGDVWDITCDELLIENSIVSTLTDASTTPTYINVRTAAGLQASGRKDTATLTLTGVSGTVTVQAVIYQQGQDITVVIPDLLGVSTGTSCGITGLPAKYSPSVARFFGVVVEDNSTDNIQQMNVAPGGTMTLYKGGSSTGFTAAGNKGLRETNLRWRL